METVIELKVNDQHLAVRKMPVIASGGCEEVELLFSFSEDWNGYTRAAVFMREDNKENNPPIKVLLPEDRCVLPHEIYRFDGSVLVGVFGLLGDTVKTSTCACLDIARGSPTEGSDPSEVTPDLFAQYLERIATDNKQTLAEMQALADELIKEGVSDSRIYGAVSEYMSENPVSGSKSAYEYAVDGGYKGTEEEFAQKLAREYLTSESDPTVPAWAKASMKPTYTKSEVGLGNVDNVKQYSASNPPPYPVTSVNGKTGAVTVTVPGLTPVITPSSTFTMFSFEDFHISDLFAALSGVMVALTSRLSSTSIR